MPALHPGAARDTVADVDPNPGHADRADDLCLVLILDPVVRDHPATRRAARRQRRGELFVHLRRDVPAARRPVLGPTLPARFPGSRFRLALRERGRLALPRALGRRQLLLESVPLSAEPIPLGCQARSLVLQAVPLVLQASDLRVLLRTVAAQPSVGVLELFDAFPGRAAEDSHPRDDSRRQGFCPGLAEKPNVSAGSDPLFNYLLSSVEHTVAGSPANSAGSCQQFRNTTDPNPALRALFIALDEWVTLGKEPPKSEVPDHTTAVFSIPVGNGVGVIPQAALGWPDIPSVTYSGVVTVRHLLDFGPHVDDGIMDINPPDFSGLVCPAESVPTLVEN